MKKMYKLVLTFLFLGIVSYLNAQVNAYSFSQNNGTYTPLAGGISVSASNTAVPDDNVYGNLPIGFTFTYNGVPQTAVGLNVNGWISFGTVTPTSNYTPISTGAINNLISGMGNDLQLSVKVPSCAIQTGSATVVVPTATLFSVGDVVYGSTGMSATGSTITAISGNSLTITPNATGTSTTVTVSRKGNLSYLTSGIAPNRVFTMEWNKVSRFGSTAYDNISFQIRLKETSNIIEVQFGSVTFWTTSNTAEVGLRGNSNADFNNRTAAAGTAWSANTAGTLNSSSCAMINTSTVLNGLNFVWTPPVPCSGTPSGGTTLVTTTLACIGQTIGLNVTGSTAATGLTYQWQSSPNGITWTPIASATTIATTQTVLAATYYQLVIACGTNTATSTSVSVAVVGAPAYATVPYLENFDNTWQNRCDNRNVPVSANWSSNPSTGNPSWRRQDDGVSAVWSSATTGTVAPLTGAGCADFHSYFAASAAKGSLDLYVDMNTTNNYTLSFYQFNNTGTDSLEVFLSTNGGSTFTKQGGYKTTGTTWTKRTINLGPVASPTCVVRFTATSDFGNDDIAIDSLQIKVGCTVPTVSVVSTSSAVCAGSSSTLTASGATTYSWSTGASANSIVVTPTANATYTVDGSNGAGCNNTQTISVAVNALPAIGATTTNTLLCVGQSAILFATGTSATYTWNTGANTSSISVSPSVTTVYTVTGSSAAGCKASTTLTQSVSACTGIETVLGNAGASIYPNPNSGSINVVISDLTSLNTIEVYDATGRLVMATELLQNQTTISTTHLSNGIYSFRIKNNSGIVKQGKLVKE